MSVELPRLGSLVGTWTSEGAHPMLPGELITGTSHAEWMDGEEFLVYQTHTDHPKIPDSLSVLGDIDGPAMHYYDSRGVYRRFALTFTTDGWSIVRDAQHDGDFRQRMTFAFDDPAETMRLTSQISRDGESWEDDLELTYRRAPDDQ